MSQSPSKKPPAISDDKERRLAQKRDKQREKKLASALRYLQRGQHKKAVHIYESLLEEYPDDPQLLLRLAQVYEKLSNLEQAVTTYQRVAETFSQQGFTSRAVAALTEARKLNPELDVLHRALAENYEALGLRSEAYRSYQRLATCFEKQFNFSAMAEALGHALKLEPSDDATRIRLAETLVLGGDQERSHELLNKAAQNYLSGEQWDAATRVLERISFLWPADAWALRTLAGIYLENGNPKKALKKLKLSLDAEENPQSFMLCAQAFEQMSMPEQATQALSMALDTAASDRSLAISIANRLIERDPEHAAAKATLEHQPSTEESWGDLLDDNESSLDALPSHQETEASTPAVSEAEEIDTPLDSEPTQELEATSVQGPRPASQAPVLERHMHGEVQLHIGSTPQPATTKPTLDRPSFLEVRHADSIGNVDDAGDVGDNAALEKENSYSLSTATAATDQPAASEQSHPPENTDPSQNDTSSRTLTRPSFIPHPKQNPSASHDSTPAEQDEDAASSVTSQPYLAADTAQIEVHDDDDEQNADAPVPVHTHQDLPSAQASAAQDDPIALGSSTTGPITDAQHPIDDGSSAQREQTLTHFDPQGLADAAEQTHGDSDASSSVTAPSPEPSNDSHETPEQAPAKLHETEATPTSQANAANDWVFKAIAHGQKKRQEREAASAPTSAVSSSENISENEQPQSRVDTLIGHGDTRIDIEVDLSDWNKDAKKTTSEYNGAHPLDGAAIESSLDAAFAHLQRPPDEDAEPDGQEEVYFDLGLAFREMGLLDEAIEAFEKARAEPQREVQSLHYMGLCYFDKHRLKESIKALLASLYSHQATIDSRAALRYDLAMALLDVADLCTARALLKKVLEDKESFRDAKTHYERLEHVTGDISEPFQSLL